MPSWQISIAPSKDDKKKIAALNKDKAALQARLAKTDAILAAIGGQLTEEEARRLILKKLYDLATSELNRYLNAEKRGLIARRGKPLGQVRRLQPRTGERTGRDAEDAGWVPTGSRIPGRSIESDRRSV